MKQSTIIWTVVLVLAGAFLIVRTSTGEMGREYVIDEQVEPENSTKTWTVSKDAAPNQTDTPGFRFSWSRTIGLWVAALCTRAIFSFLYGDNPLYKLAEAVFVGSSAGYAMAIGFWDGIVTLRGRTPGETIQFSLLDADAARQDR